MALKAHKSTWLFDCGEDSQRQVHKQPMIRHGKLDRIFLTNRRANNVLGLPGGPSVLCPKTLRTRLSSSFMQVPKAPGLPVRSTSRLPNAKCLKASLAHLSCSKTGYHLNFRI